MKKIEGLPPPALASNRVNTVYLGRARISKIIGLRRDLEGLISNGISLGFNESMIYRLLFDEYFESLRKRVLNEPQEILRRLSELK